MTISNSSLSIATRINFENACYLAGLLNVSLISENFAAAIFYIYNESHTINETNFLILFINVGYSSTKLTLVQIEINKQKK